MTAIPIVRALSIVVAICGLLSACDGRSADHPQLNVVVITLDTTRADRLSPYGYMDASMPALERIAREGVVFDRAMTVAPSTLPAHTSMFTGSSRPTTAYVITPTVRSLRVTRRWRRRYAKADSARERSCHQWDHRIAGSHRDSSATWTCRRAMNAGRDDSSAAATRS